MKLQPMKYKGFSWPHNPETLTISRQREIKELKLPFSGGMTLDYGAEKRVIEGEGEFYGADCMEQFQKLSAVLEEEGSGILTLPNLPPFPARFVSLRMVGGAQPDLIRYRFVFREDGKSAAQGAAARYRSYQSAQGENLWAVAALFSTTVEELLALNPFLKWPNCLREGELVMLP